MLFRSPAIISSTCSLPSYLLLVACPHLFYFSVTAQSVSSLTSLDFEADEQEPNTPPDNPLPAENADPAEDDEEPSDLDEPVGGAQPDRLPPRKDRTPNWRTMMQAGKRICRGFCKRACRMR